MDIIKIHDRDMMITCGISLAACSIILRRIIDTVTGTAALVPDTTPHAAIIAVGSTALLGICRQMRLGTRVNVGNGRPQQKLNRSSRQLNHDHPARNSWFIRNILGGRKKCVDAISKLVKEYLDSQPRVEQIYKVQNPSVASISGDEDEREVRSGTIEVGAGEGPAGPLIQVQARPSILKKEGMMTRRGSWKKREVVNIDEMELQLHRPKATKLKKVIRQKKAKFLPKILDPGRRTRSGKIYNPCT